KPTSPPAPVKVAVAETRDVPVLLDGVGTVTARSSVAVKSRVSGELSKVHFQEGQEVKKGEKLFSIDPRPFEASLAQNEASMARDGALAENARADVARKQEL